MKTNSNPHSATPIFWAGRLSCCDECGQQFGIQMYDCATAGPGSAWGNLCHSCWTFAGKPLGYGKGQRYEKQADGRWLKVAG